MATAVTPKPFIPGFRLVDGNDLNNRLALQQYSSQDGITAKASGIQATATQLVAALNRVSTVATAADAVKLPASQVGLEVTVVNSGANAMQVFGFGTDTINSVATATGVSQPAGVSVVYRCFTLGNWIQTSSASLSSVVLNGSTSGTTTLAASAIAGTTTITFPAQTGTVALTNPTPRAGGASLAVTAAMANAPILLDTAAGTTATLPAATGTGATYRFVVTTTTTSGAHKILAASSADFMNGIVTGETSGTAKCFASAAATNHSLQMPFSGTQPSGGFIGDWFDITDVATNLWSVKGMYQAGTTPTTPFSAATS